MQAYRYSSGGYCAHKIVYAGGKLSAYYADNGALLDLEKFDKNGRKTGSGIQAACEYAQSIFNHVKMLAMQGV